MKYAFQSGKRAFLNRPGFHGDASIGYYLRVDENGWLSGYLNIRDCSQDVSLELNVHDDEWYDNTKEKLDLMISILKDAKKNLPAARRALAKAKAEKKNNED